MANIDFIGRRISYGIAKETTRGTAATTAAHWIPHLSADLQDKHESALNNSAMGVIDLNNDAIVTQIWSEGKIEGKIQVESFGLILLAALGQVTSAAGAKAGTFKHNFTRLNSNLSPSLTIFEKSPAADLKYELSCLKSLEIDIVTGEYVKYTADFIGRRGVPATSTVTFVESEAEFTSKYCQLKMAANKAGLAAAPRASIKSAKVKIERNTEAYYEAGSVTPAEIHNKAFDVSFECERRYSDNTLKDASLKNTKYALELSMVNTDDKIGTAKDENPSLKFTLPAVVISEWERDQGLDDVVMEKFTVQGLFSAANGTQIEAELVNSTASY